MAPGEGLPGAQEEAEISMTSPELIDHAVALDEDGPHQITVTATDTAGNTATETRTVYRDTTPPQVLWWDFDKVPFGPGKLSLSVTLYDAVAGIDHAVNPTVTLTPPGSDPITATQTGYADGVWSGSLVIPPDAPAGTCRVRISGVRDTLGNELAAGTSGQGSGADDDPYDGDTDVTFVNTPPDTDPPEESGRTGLKILTSGSYASPAYVQGTKPEDAADVWWRYKGASGWESVSSTGVVGDTWWALFVDIDRSGETQDLTQDNREVTIEVTSGNAAGTGAIAEQKITWKVTEIGESRPETRYKTLDGEPVAYQVTVTDHLVQIGDGSMSSQSLTPPPTRCTLMVAARR
jgi:hypothetical protein